MAVDMGSAADTGSAVDTGAKPGERQLPPELYAQLDDYIDGLGVDPENPRRKETLSQALRKAQLLFGYLPDEVQLHVANRYRISPAVVSGVVSFYNYFTTKPKGRVQVSVCMGTACYVNGADQVLHECESQLGISAGEVTPDGQYSIESLRCLGVCGLAPVVTVNEQIHGHVRPKQVKGLLDRGLAAFEGKEEGDRAEG